MSITRNLYEQFWPTKLPHLVAGIFSLHVLAYFSQAHWTLGLFAGVIGVSALAVSIYRLELGVALAFLEIIIGGHGHLFDLAVGGFDLSVRMLILAGVLGGTLYHLVKGSRPKFVPRRDFPLAALAVAVFWGGAVGYFNNPTALWFDDLNSYLILVYWLPLSLLEWSGVTKRFLLQTLTAGVIWVIISTLALLYTFSHLNAKGIWTLYVFVRDSRLFEVTLLSGPAWVTNLLWNGDWYFRVFSQGQFFIFVLFLFALAFAWQTKTSTRLCEAERSEAEAIYSTKMSQLMAISVYALTIGLVAVAIASLSRSFYVGLVPAVFLALLVPLIFGSRRSLRSFIAPRTLGKFSLSSIAVMAAALVTLFLCVTLPLPSRPDLRSSPFYKGDSDDTRELAVSSRWNLLDPMLDQIRVSPLIGSGFGQEVTFISDDPRIRAINQTGEWTTTRFEWGMLDVWLKMGILGIIAVVYLGVAIALNVRRSLAANSSTAWLTNAGLAIIIFLYAVHFFSPYLNHPIGLFALLLIFFLTDWPANHHQISTPIDNPEPSPALSLNPTPDLVTTRYN